MSSPDSGGAKAVILIVHALLWAAAMLGVSYFFKDQPWSENLFLWMVAGFILSNGLLMSRSGRSGPRC